MTDKFTTLHDSSGVSVFSGRGYLHRDVVIDHARRHYEAELFKAERILADIREGRISVTQHTGLYRRKNVRRLDV